MPVRVDAQQVDVERRLEIRLRGGADIGHAKELAGEGARGDVEFADALEVEQLDARHDIGDGLRRAARRRRRQPDRDDLALGERRLLRRAAIRVVPEEAAGIGHHQVGLAVAVQVAHRRARREGGPGDAAVVGDHELASLDPVDVVLRVDAGPRHVGRHGVVKAAGRKEVRRGVGGRGKGEGVRRRAEDEREGREAGGQGAESRRCRRVGRMHKSGYETNSPHLPHSNLGCNDCHRGKTRRRPACPRGVLPRAGLPASIRATL